MDPYFPIEEQAQSLPVFPVLDMDQQQFEMSGLEKGQGILNPTLWEPNQSDSGFMDTFPLASENAFGDSPALEATAGPAFATDADMSIDPLVLQAEAWATESPTHTLPETTITSFFGGNDGAEDAFATADAHMGIDSMALQNEVWAADIPTHSVPNTTTTTTTTFGANYGAENAYTANDANMGIEPAALHIDVWTADIPMHSLPNTTSITTTFGDNNGAENALAAPAHNYATDPDAAAPQLVNKVSNDSFFSSSSSSSSSQEPFVFSASREPSPTCPDSSNLPAELAPAGLQALNGESLGEQMVQLPGRREGLLTSKPSATMPDVHTTAQVIDERRKSAGGSSNKYGASGLKVCPNRTYYRAVAECLEKPDMTASSHLSLTKTQLAAFKFQSKEHYLLDSGVLYRKPPATAAAAAAANNNKKNGKRSKPAEPKPVLPAEAYHLVLLWAHSSDGDKKTTAGPRSPAKKHHGRDDTYRRVTDHFASEGLNKQLVDQWIKSCPHPKCSQNRAAGEKAKGGKRRKTSSGDASFTDDRGTSEEEHAHADDQHGDFAAALTEFLASSEGPAEPEQEQAQAEGQTDGGAADLHDSLAAWVQTGELEEERAAENQDDSLAAWIENGQLDQDFEDLFGQGGDLEGLF